MTWHPSIHSGRAHPPVATSLRTQKPLIFNQAAFRTAAHSLCPICNCIPSTSVYPPFGIKSGFSSYPVLPRARRSSEDRQCRCTRASPEAEASRRNGGDGTSAIDGKARPLAARRKNDENLDQGSALSAEIQELEYGRVYEDGEVPTGSLALRGCFLKYSSSRERLSHC